MYEVFDAQPRGSQHLAILLDLDDAKLVARCVDHGEVYDAHTDELVWAVEDHGR